MDFGRNEDDFYKDLIQNNLNAWYKFIPHHNEMHSNCWYVRNFKSLPVNLTRKVKETYSFLNIQDQFPDHELRSIMTNLLGKSNASHFSKQRTRHHFCLPSVYIIGFPKCGTSLLYNYIKSHPLFASPRFKEGQFWRELVTTQDLRYRELEVLIYMFHFYDASRNIDKNRNKFTVDASASTVYASSRPLHDTEKDLCLVPFLLFRVLPQTKILIILRNPIDRLWSDYWYFCSRYNWRTNKVYNIPRHISAVASELFHNLSISAIAQFKNCTENGNSEFHCSTLTGSAPGKKGSCTNVRLGLSMYYLHVIRWLNIFPRNQIHIIRINDLSTSPRTTMNHVWDFIGVHKINSTIIGSINKNPWILMEDYKTNFTMWPRTRILLEFFFKSYNMKLAQLLNDEHYLWNNETFVN